MSDDGLTQPRMGYTKVRGSDGTDRLVWGRLPEPKPAGRKKAERRQPDPINANPDAAAQKIKLYIERIERLEEEKAGINQDIADVYSEIKCEGFDAKIIRKIIDLRKIDPSQRQEIEALLDIYKTAIGID